MKKLINTLKKIKNILIEFEKFTNKEYLYLLENQPSLKKLNLILKKKRILLQKFIVLKFEQSVLEKKYNIFIPYLKCNTLNIYWNNILQKSLFLKKINLRNKIIINQKFYLNQHFLNMIKPCKKNIIYDTFGNVEN